MMRGLQKVSEQVGQLIEEAACRNVRHLPVQRGADSFRKAHNHQAGTIAARQATGSDTDHASVYSRTLGTP